MNFFDVLNQDLLFWGGLKESVAMSWIFQSP